MRFLPTVLACALTTPAWSGDNSADQTYINTNKPAALAITASAQNDTLKRTEPVYWASCDLGSKGTIFNKRGSGVTVTSQTTSLVNNTGPDGSWADSLNSLSTFASTLSAITYSNIGYGGSGETVPTVFTKDQTLICVNGKIIGFAETQSCALSDILGHTFSVNGVSFSFPVESYGYLPVTSISYKIVDGVNQPYVTASWVATIQASYGKAPVGTAIYSQSGENPTHAYFVAAECLATGWTVSGVAKARPYTERSLGGIINGDVLASSTTNWGGTGVTGPVLTNNGVAPVYRFLSENTAYQRVSAYMATAAPLARKGTSIIHPAELSSYIEHQYGYSALRVLNSQLKPNYAGNSNAQ